MTAIPCHRCGQAHDLVNLEPSFRKPDEVAAVPVAERDHRLLDGNDHCLLRDSADTWRKYFLRVLLPVRVEGWDRPCSWGIWVEVAEADYRRTLELWRDPEQGKEPPFPGSLVNKCPGYPQTIGLPGMVQLISPSTIPHFRFLESVEHPLATDQRQGVTPERVLEWLMPWLHPGSK